MTFPLAQCALLLLLAFSVPSPAAEPAAIDAELAAIRQRVADARQQLGDRAGEPEEPDKYLAIPKQGSWLNPAEAKPAFAKAHPILEKIRWWKIGLDPAKLTHPLREPAAVVSGCVHAIRAGLDGSARSLELAREAGDFLLWAQDQGGRGLFPFPASRGGESKAFQSAARAIARAEREGRAGEMIHGGWAVDDLGDGGLQFDNAEAGVAIFELYEATGDPKYLASARKAADWAMARPLAANWNYNSFSVYLLAKAFEVTGDAPYLKAATHKARVGVVPGQLTDGPRAGRWLDPHNAKPAYHYIMMRALLALVAVLPPDHPARPEVMQCLRLGLRARNQDLLGPGAANKDKTLEALVLAHHVWAKEPALLKETLSAEALEALGKLVSEQYRRGASPLGPREWGLFLEFATGR